MTPTNYLHFIATFADGTQIFQNAEDKGSVEGHNCFYDVLQKQLDTPLVCFVLAGENYPTFGVDLKDGHFEVNQVPFFQHSEPLQDFSLIYYRDVRQHRTFKQKDGQLVEPMDTADVGYTLGWKTTHRDQEVERYLKIV